MKRKRWCLIIAAVMLLSLTACSAGVINESAGSVGSAPGADYDSMVGESLKDGATVEIGDERKIIETIELSIQTKDFDTLLDSLRSQIAALGGYIENSSVSGREIDSYNNRYANMTVRIPADQSESFSQFVSQNSVIVRESVSTEDVTLQYVDTESRLKALQAEQASLEKLLESAQSTDDIIAIRKQLTDVIYQIESYTSQLRAYDNLVAYSTVTMYIQEVEQTAVSTEKGVWERIGANLHNNFASLWDGAVEVFIFAVSALPFLLIPILVAVIIAVIVIVRRARKKKKKSSDNHTDAHE